jgi:hypothetical protein
MKPNIKIIEAIIKNKESKTCDVFYKIGGHNFHLTIIKNENYTYPYTILYNDEDLDEGDNEYTAEEFYNLFKTFNDQLDEIYYN